MLFPNLFNTAKVLTASVVESVMGEPVTWESTPEVTGFGLYRNPTGPQVIVNPAQRSDGAEFNSELPTFRYKAGAFPGLYEFVRSGEPAILRRSNGSRYVCGEIKRVFDGDTFNCLLEPIKS